MCMFSTERESSKSLMCDKHVVHVLYLRSEWYVIAIVCCDCSTC